ncbi:hypothetical protein JS530_06315 [Bifidobacterium sp. LC6]|uniref:Uncharacterized protein n=1 Tax=Bifidobacterium colobi TaxID=2809026 RepID=A0ABS5UVG5_9BIFI|nr:hypothetical protein [Bifidobacterium colobi]MBT1175116.1 hypothetical protein [Bifidobacterium colobi]
MSSSTWDVSESPAAASTSAPARKPVPLSKPLWVQGSPDVAKHAAWAERASGGFGFVMGVIGILVLLCFIITGIGGIQYRIGTMWHTHHGDDPYIVVTATDVVLILLCILFIAFPALFILSMIWTYIDNTKNRIAKRKFQSDPRTLGVRTNVFDPDIVFVSAPDKDDHDNGTDEFNIHTIIFQPTTTFPDFRMLAYVPTDMWKQYSGARIPRNPSGIRKCMAWLTLRIYGARIGIVDIEPIDAEQVIKAYDRNGRDAEGFEYPDTAGTELDSGRYLIRGSARSHFGFDF